MTKPDASTWTIFLDRDGVLNPHPRVAIRAWDQFSWLPGAKEAVVALHKTGATLCLATNQPTVGMGITPKRRIEAVHAALQADLQEAGAGLHRVEAAYPVFSRRRKPNPGMFEDAAAAFEADGHAVNKSRAIMVGDKPKDAQAGNAFGIPAILLATTHTRQDLQERIQTLGIRDVCIVSDLAEAAEEIMERMMQAEASN